MMFPSMHVHLLITSSRSAIVGRNPLFQVITVTLTHSPSRRTGTVTRPVRTGTGLLSAFLSVVAVMNSLGRPQGLPLIPETVSSPGVSATDEYDDVLGRHHEDCISSLSPKEHWILFDSGAAAHRCPLDYAPTATSRKESTKTEKCYW